VENDIRLNLNPIEPDEIYYKLTTASSLWIGCFLYFDYRLNEVKKINIYF
jgi:hypothetical protein